MDAILTELIHRYPQLAELRSAVAAAAEMMIQCYRRGGRILLAGNGGSAADAEHITGELLKGFCSKRPLPEALQQRLIEVEPEQGGYLAQHLQQGLPALNCANFLALNTAFGNDVDNDLTIAQQILAQGREGDLFIGISTGGNAANIYYGLLTAKALRISSLLLTGCRAGRCTPVADLALCVPECETFKIQELHLPIYHALCRIVEREFYGE